MDPFIVYDDTADSTERLFKNDRIKNIFMEGQHHNFPILFLLEKQKVMLMPGKKYCDVCDGTAVQDTYLCNGCGGKGMISCDSHTNTLGKSMTCNAKRLIDIANKMIDSGEIKIEPEKLD